MVHGPAETRFDDYYRWDEPESDMTVYLRLETMDRLQINVLRDVAPPGQAGSETGGLLLGRMESGEGRRVAFVEDFEPVSGEDHDGPAYSLTVRDDANFEAALMRTRARQSLTAIGYYRSHHRHGLFLSTDDMRIIQRHFRDSRSVFLLIKVLPERVCTAGFFFWKNGTLQTEFTESEVPLIPVSVAAAGRSAAAPSTDAGHGMAFAGPGREPDTRPGARSFTGPEIIHRVTPATAGTNVQRFTSGVQVRVNVAIDASGRVTAARVLPAAGNSAGWLADEALNAARLHRFKPARENGRNIASSTVLTFCFGPKDTDSGSQE